MQWESTVFTYGSARQPPELQHYGIKGQRWGQRRFQEEDGTYTAAGRERYRNSSGKTGGLKKSRAKGSKKENRRNWKPEDAENLSDEELNKRNSRMQREQQYRDSTTPKWKKEAKQTAKDWTKEAIKKIFIASAVVIAADVVRRQYKKAQNNIEQYSHSKLSELRQPSSTRDAIRKATNNYGQGGRKTRDIYAQRNARMDRFNKVRSRGRSSSAPENIRFNWKNRG